jgi:hypothetical protein
MLYVLLTFCVCANQGACRKRAKVSADSGTGSPSFPAPVLQLPNDIIERVTHSPGLTLRDLAHMAGTCKVFSKAVLNKLDAEVQWLTDLTYTAFGNDTVEVIISWLLAKPSKRRELFGPCKQQRLIMHNNSASEGSGSRPGSQMLEPERRLTLENIPFFESYLLGHLRALPHLVICRTQPPDTASGVPRIRPITTGAYGAQVWWEMADESSVTAVPCIGLLLLMGKRVAESRNECKFRRLTYAGELVSSRTWPPNVKNSGLPENWERARDAFRLWLWRCLYGFGSQPWGKISKTEPLRRR